MIETSQGNSTGALLSFTYLNVARWLAGLAAISYVTIRLFSVALYSDELGQIVNVIERGIVDLLVFAYVDAQVHFLPGLLALPISYILPDYPIFTVRILSVPAFILYLWAAWKITSGFRPWLASIGFLALLANAFMLDWFSLGRGYSLALGFQMLSLYCLFRALNDLGQGKEASGWFGGSIWAASLSTLAILSFVSFYCALLSVCFVALILRKRHDGSDWITAIFDSVRNGQHLLYNAALLGIFYLPRVLQLIRFKQLYAGGTDGFVPDTVMSLVRTAFYQRVPSENMLLILSIGVVGLSLIASIDLLLRFLISASDDVRVIKGLCVSGILAIMAIFHIALFHVMGIRYSVERMALCFYPLYILLMIFWASQPTHLSRVSGTAVLCASIIIGLNGVNLNRMSWISQAQNPQIIDDLAEMYEQTGEPIVVGVTDYLKYTLFWYAKNRLGLTRQPQPEGTHGDILRQYDWLTIYTLNYGGHRLFAQNTTHVALFEREMTTNDIPRRLSKVREYPAAAVNLYRVVPNSQPFNP